MRFGLDSTSMVPTAAHHAVGSSFACRYLSRYSWKALRSSEVSAYHASGIDLAVVFEDFANNALSGHSRGVADAQFAASQAKGLGMPENRPIYFAVDLDATPAQQGAINDYFRGVASVIGHTRTGIYAGYWPVKRCFDAGVIAYAWQTYAWSGGSVDSRAQLYQYSNGHTVGGVGVDYNHALKDDFGQWSYHPPAPPKPPKPGGVASATLRYDLANSKWSVHGTPGNVVWFPQNKTVSTTVSLDIGAEGHGQWRVK